MSVNLPPRLDIARRETPLLKLERLPAELDLPGELWIKRDDLTGCALSGNKIRKLEFLAAEAQAQGATTLITCGGIQSNHCRATAVLAARLGWRCVLVLRGEEPEQVLGNLLINRLVGAEVRWVTGDEYRHQRDRIMAELAAQERARGETPYVIPEGGSNALGAFAYVDVVREILAADIDFQVVCHAVGSGGTSAGLIAGRALHGANFELLGFPVCDDVAYFQQSVGDILKQMALDYQLPVADLTGEFEDGYKGVGYAVTTAEEDAFIKLVARREGLILDPAYTGKAFRGVVEELRAGRFGANPRVLFIHTGGIFGSLARSW